MTGFEGRIAVYSDSATFSSCNSVIGPFASFSVPLRGDNISASSRSTAATPFSDQLPSFDPPKHTQQRALTMRLITPKRLKENEEFMWRLADRQIDEFLARSECWFHRRLPAPYTLLVIADLLGVPESDHGTFRAKLAGPVDRRARRDRAQPLQFLYEQFTAYIEDRRRRGTT